MYPAGSHVEPVRGVPVKAIAAGPMALKLLPLVWILSSQYQKNHAIIPSAANRLITHRPQSLRSASRLGPTFRGTLDDEGDHSEDAEARDDDREDRSDELCRFRHLR